ncbi:MAG: mannitol dehydrogenase family protein [Proteobacteria bacterium]|nr:mannitol dehydrogenase family protein [Pseudomonadota bacterium]
MGVLPISSLSLATLAGLPPGVLRPGYDPAQVRAGIIHLGLGAFHRAHQAVYTNAVLARDPRWGICGVSLKTPRATSELAHQDGLYTVLWKSPEATRAEVIASVRETLFAGDERARLVQRFADPRIAVVSSTVTEKGYCHDPATGTLNFAHPDIVHDLATPDMPVSAVGLLVAGLAARRAAGGGGLTIICCDNLPRNGRTLQGLVAAFAEARDPHLARWIAEHAAFPDTMVDRIVPAATDDDRALARTLTGVDDPAVVAAEPFGQWVIERRFAGAHPAWDEVGAQYATDVGVYETMKLRLLNGSHSAFAYLGFLMGYATVWQASGDPLLAGFVERMMGDEIAPTVAPPPGIDLADYRRSLLARYRNPALPHRTQQIAMDGSQKIPQRWLNTIRDRIAARAPWPRLAVALGAWIRYASGVDEHGALIDVVDPLAATFRTLATRRDDPAALADGFLDLAAVFGDLSSNAAFRADVRNATVAIFRDGAKATLATQPA